MKIVHVMKDGRRLDSIEGMVIPVKECPEFYRVLERLIRKREEEEEADEDRRVC